MQSSTAVFVAPLGRILLALIFVVSGVSKFGSWQDTIQMMIKQGVPSPEILLSVAVVLELVGGLMVLSGFQARWGAVLLIVFLGSVTYFMHNFWNAPQEQQQMQMIQFMKNLTILGGLLYVVAFGAGALSLDQLRIRKQLRGRQPGPT